MGLILNWIFGLENIIIIFGVLAFMGTFAAYTIRGNLEKIPGVFNATLPGLLIGGLSVIAASWALGIIGGEGEAGEFLIPMGGMVIGNIMGLSSLVIERMWSTAQKQRGLIETALALGATPEQASDMTIRESIESGMLPNLNRYASLGIVSIPGLMSGMIIGGMSPIAAAFYQVIVFIMIFLAVVIGSLITSRIFIRYMFNERYQLIVPPPEA
jgi:putative ABC transport system permease protein